jgi:DNA-binding sugar fermentation-stimulating protein
MELYLFPTPLVRAEVLHRPSTVIKSPYVADIRLEDGTTALCHTPGLGCCGMVAPGRVIYVTKSSGSGKTAWAAQVAECTDRSGIYFVGINPMVCQHAAAKLLPLINADTAVVWKSEVTVSEGVRLDYVGSTESKKTYVEVKTAMIAHESHETERRDTDTRRAIFPEGFRKHRDDPVSPRAIKHAKHLGELAAGGDTAVLCFIVPRTDCGDGMEPSHGDPAYCAAVRESVRKGTIVRAFALDFDVVHGVVKLARELPFYLS